jgi:hypothetical protein
MMFKHFKNKTILVKEEDWGMKQTLSISLNDYGELELEKMKIMGGNGSGSVTRFSPEEFIALKKLIKDIEVIKDV